MSPPDTNIAVQTRRHWFPIAGIAFVVAVVFAGFLFWLGGELSTDEAIDPAVSPALEGIEPLQQPEPPTGQ